MKGKLTGSFKRWDPQLFGILVGSGSRHSAADSVQQAKNPCAHQKVWGIAKSAQLPGAWYAQAAGNVQQNPCNKQKHHVLIRRRRV